ncbi:MAG: hypothetical protein ACXACC_08030 [Promethearchaeota archaeon]|jgi:uncharacterized protein YbjQ (UPF0145 family)
MGKKAWEHIIISETNDIPGKKIVKTLGKVKIKHGATEALKQGNWIYNAPNKLKKVAYKLGANAITNARFTYTSIETIYNGMAVIVEEKD